MSTTTDNVFTYEKLVLNGVAHPTRVRILMVMGEDADKRWSPSDMTVELNHRRRTGEEPFTLGAVSYHFRTLAAKRWIVKSGKPGRVRGALENFYKIDGRRV